MIRAIKEAQELYNSGTIPKNFMNMSADDWLTLEQNGQVAFAERGPTYYKNLQDKKTSKVVGVCVRDLPLPEGVVVGAIVRDEELLMGSKKLVIQSGDHVLMVLIDVGKIHEVEALFLENES